MSRWAAAKYLGGERTVLEAGYIDPVGVFPVHVMKSVHYAMKYGIDAEVTLYAMAEGGRAGAVLTLYVGDKDIGHYVVKLRD